MTDPDRAARLSLRRHRAFATGLLAVMAGLAAAALALPPSPAAAILEAAARAGFIGGLADWFAVTALFRHPLGLPIPHTAILPRQKQRLGRALGRFVATRVFTETEVAGLLHRIDLPEILRRFLSDPQAARPAAAALATLLPRLLATVEDGRARRMVARIAPRLLGGPGAGIVVARALRGLVEGGRHQEAFGFVLGEFRTLLEGREEALRAAIEERVREQGGRLVGWAMGATIARRVLAALNAEMDRIGPDGSELRLAFDEWVRREITRLEEDPARAAELGAAIRRVVAHETVLAWLWDVWARLRHALEADLTRQHSRVTDWMEGALANLGTLLAEDAPTRARLDGAAGRIAASLLPSAQTRLADFIAEVVAGWDSATITENLELRVGPDLQFVRINGTLVGFLAGGMLEAGLLLAGRL
ncbi:MAG: DUF445 domain-containing protein [Rhodospirillales bacterium]|nr:DUF445 domain-containing protein [Rhodospirillales bacterium]